MSCGHYLATCITGINDNYLATVLHCSEVTVIQSQQYDNFSVTGQHLISLNYHCRIVTVALLSLSRGIELSYIYYVGINCLVFSTFATGIKDL